METISNVVNTATKAIWGEQPNATGNETAGNEPVSGVQGKGTASDPYDQGNSEDPADPTTGNETAGSEPVSGLQGKGTASDPYDQGNSEDATDPIGKADLTDLTSSSTDKAAPISLPIRLHSSSSDPADTFAPQSESSSKIPDTSSSGKPFASSESTGLSSEKPLGNRVGAGIITEDPLGSRVGASISGNDTLGSMSSSGLGDAKPFDSTASTGLSGTNTLGSTTSTGLSDSNTLGSTGSTGLGDDKPLGNTESTGLSGTNTHGLHTDSSQSQVPKISDTATGGDIKPLEMTEGTGVTGANAQKYEPIGRDVAPSESSSHPGVDPSSGVVAQATSQGADKPLVAPEGAELDAVKPRKEEAEDVLSGKRDPIHGSENTRPAAVATDSGDFDASKPGAGKEAGRIIEQQSIQKDEKSAVHPPSEESSGAGEKEKVSKVDKLKEKLHIGHKK